MKNRQEQIWIESLKADFPEYKDVIELYNLELDHFKELIEDFYFCKQQIKKLENEDKPSMKNKFKEAEDELADEIRLMLSSRKANH